LHSGHFPYIKSFEPFQSINETELQATSKNYKLVLKCADLGIHTEELSAQKSMKKEVYLDLVCVDKDGLGLRSDGVNAGFVQSRLGASCGTF
jgi:hypothetical protein